MFSLTSEALSGLRRGSLRRWPLGREPVKRLSPSGQSGVAREWREGVTTSGVTKYSLYDQALLG